MVENDVLRREGIVVGGGTHELALNGGKPCQMFDVVRIARILRHIGHNEGQLNRAGRVGCGHIDRGSDAQRSQRKRHGKEKAPGNQVLQKHENAENDAAHDLGFTR